MDSKQEKASSKRLHKQQQQQSHLLHVEAHQEKSALQQQPGDIPERQHKQEYDQQSSPRLKSKQQQQLHQEQQLPQEQQQQQQKATKYLTETEREYWQHKLPPGFQFYLERLARCAIRHQPENIVHFCAVYLQELLVSRNAELWKLPTESYFVKLYRKRIGDLPWQPHRRQRSPEPQVELTLNTETLPDVVATENLPKSSLTSAEITFSPSLQQRDEWPLQDQEVTGDSPDMVTASECLDRQMVDCGTEDRSSLEAGHHTTAPSASSDGSNTSMDVADDTDLPPADAPVRGNATLVWGLNLNPEIVIEEHQATHSAAPADASVRENATLVWGLNLNPEIVHEEHQATHSAAPADASVREDATLVWGLNLNSEIVHEEHQATHSAAPVDASVREDVTLVWGLNPSPEIVHEEHQATHSAAPADATVRRKATPVWGLNPSPEIVHEEHQATHSAYVEGQVQFGSREESAIFSLGNNVGAMVVPGNGPSVGEMAGTLFDLGFELPEVNCYTGEGFLNEQPGLNFYTDEELLNEQPEVNFYTDEEFLDEQPDVNFYSGDEFMNEHLELHCNRNGEYIKQQLKLYYSTDDAPESEQTELNSYIDDGLDNEQPELVLNSCIDDVLDNEQPELELNSGRDEGLDNEQPELELNSGRDDVLDNEQPELGLNSGRDNVFDNEQESLNSGRDVVFDNEQPELGLNSGRDNVFDNEQERLNSGRDDVLDNEQPELGLNSGRGDVLDNEQPELGLNSRRDDVFDNEKETLNSGRDDVLDNEQPELWLNSGRDDVLDNEQPELWLNSGRDDVLDNQQPELGLNSGRDDVLDNEQPELGLNSGIDHVLDNEQERLNSGRDDVLENEQERLNSCRDDLLTRREKTGDTKLVANMAAILDDENKETEIFDDENKETEIFDDENKQTEIFDDEFKQREILGKELYTAEVLRNEFATTETLGREITTTEILGDELISSGILNNELMTEDIAARELISTEILGHQLSITEIPGNGLKPRKIVNSEVTTSDILDAAIVTTEVFYKGSTTEEILGSELTTGISSEQLTSIEILSKELNTSKILNQELNATEKVNQELNAAEILNQELNTAEILNKELNATEVLNQELNVAEILNQELNATEILNQELNAAEILNQELHTAEILNQELNATEILNQELNATEKVNQELNATEILNQELNAAEILNQELNATEILNQELNATEILNQELNVAEILNKELNATEILNKELNTAEILNQELNTAEILNQELNASEVLNQELNATEILNQELNATEILNQELNATEVLNQELNATDLLNQELNSTEILNQELNATEILNEELNATEILNQELNATEILNQELHTAEILNQELNATEILNQELNATEILNQELNATEILNQELNAAEILNQELNATEILNQELNATEILNQELNVAEILNKELNATEILNKELNTAEILNQELNTAEILNQELNATEVLNQELNATEILNQELNATEILNQELNATEVLNQELNATDLLNQELNSTEILNQELNATEILNEELNATEILNQELNATELLNQELNATEILNQELNATEIPNQELNTTEIMNQELNATEKLNQEQNVKELLGRELGTDNHEAEKGETTQNCLENNPGKQNFSDGELLMGGSSLAGLVAPAVLITIVVDVPSRVEAELCVEDNTATCRSRELSPLTSQTVSCSCCLYTSEMRTNTPAEAGDVYGGHAGIGNEPTISQGGSQNCQMSAVSMCEENCASNVAALDSPISVHNSVDSEGGIKCEHNVDKTGREVSEYEITNAMPHEGIDLIITGEVPSESHFMEEEVTKEKEPTWQKVLSAHCEASCVPVSGLVVGRRSNMADLETSQQSKQTIENDVMHGLLIVEQNPQDVLKPDVKPLAVIQDSAPLSDSSTDDEDSDTCDPISEIQNDERSLKVEHASSHKKCRETSLRADDVRSAQGKRGIRQTDSAEVQREICQRENNDARVEDVKDENDDNKGQSLQLEQPLNTSPQLSPHLHEALDTRSCGEEVSAEEKDSRKDVMNGNEELVDGGTRGEIGSSFPLSAGCQFVHSCSLTENWTPENHGNQHPGADKYENVEDNREVSDKKGSDFGEEHEGIIQVAVDSPSDVQEVAMDELASSVIHKMDLSHTFLDSQAKDGDFMCTTQDNPTMQGSQPCQVDCLHTSENPTFQNFKLKHTGRTYTRQDSLPAQAMQAILCALITIGNHLQADKQEQRCYHRDGLGKRKMERALSLAKTYVCELEKVAENIENILQTKPARTTQEPVVKDNIENGVTFSAVQHATASENEPDFDGTSVNSAPETRHSGFELKVSGSFLNEVSHKVVDVWEGRASLGSSVDDSQAADVEYRTGNVVFKIERVQSCSCDCESQVNIGANCEGMLSLSVSSAGDNVHKVTSVGMDVHNSGMGETGESLVCESQENINKDSLSNYNNMGENNSSDKNWDYNQHVSEDNVCSNENIDNSNYNNCNNNNCNNCNNSNYNNCNNDGNCCSEYNIKWQTNFYNDNIRTINSRQNLHNRKNMNAKKQQNTNMVSSVGNNSLPNKIKEYGEGNYRNYCCNFNIGDMCNLAWNMLDHFQFEVAKFVDVAAVIYKGCFILQATSEILHSTGKPLQTARETLHMAGETLHSTNKLHNINNNGNIMGSEPRNFALSTESSNISITKKEADIILGKKSLLPPGSGTKAHVDIMVIDGNKTYLIPRDAIQACSQAVTDNGLQVTKMETPKMTGAVAQQNNRQVSSQTGTETPVASSRAKSASVSGGIPKQRNLAVQLHPPASKSRCKSAESLTREVKANEKHLGDRKPPGTQRANTSLADCKPSKPVSPQGNVKEDSHQRVIGGGEVVGKNKNRPSPRCYCQTKKKEHAEKQQNKADGKLQASGVENDGHPLLYRCKKPRDTLAVQDKEVVTRKRAMKQCQQSVNENKMPDSHTTNAPEQKRCKRIILHNDAVQVPGEHVDIDVNGDGTKKSGSPTFCFEKKKDSLKRQENANVERGVRSSGSIPGAPKCSNKCQGENSAVADKENDNGVAGVKPHQQSTNGENRGLQKSNTFQSNLFAKCTLPQNDTREDAEQETVVANEIGGGNKRKRSPICYLQNKKKEHLEQKKTDKQEMRFPCSASPVCGKKPPCPSKQETEKSQVLTEEIPMTIYVNSSSARASRYFPQDINNQPSMSTPSKTMLDQIPRQEFLDNRNVLAVNYPGEVELSVPVPSRRDFPIRIRAVSKHDTNTEYLPTLTRRLTIESPAENLLVHSSYIRPNPRQPEHARTFEVSSQRRRFYLGEGEGDEFINTQGTRRLICETECFSSKDPRTKHLVVENGTSSVMHATVKVVSSSVRKRKKRFASVSSARQASQEPAIITHLIPEVSRDRTPTWQENDNFRKVGKYFVIGNSTNTGSIQKLLHSQEAGAFSADNTNTSTNAVHGTLVGEGECATVLCNPPLSGHVSGNGRGDHHIVTASFRNIVDNNNNNNNYKKNNNCTYSNNTHAFRDYFVNRNYKREKLPHGVPYNSQANCWRTTVKSDHVVNDSTTSSSSTFVDVDDLGCPAHSVGLMNKAQIFPMKTVDTDVYKNSTLVNDADRNNQLSPPDGEYFLGRYAHNSNNNSKNGDRRYISKSTSINPSHFSELPGQRRKAEEEQGENDKVSTTMHSMKCCICEGPGLSGRSRDEQVSLETQVDIRDITVTRETQTGESLNYMPRVLHQRHRKEIDKGPCFCQSQPDFCSERRREVCPSQDTGTQVDTSDICSDVEIQAGYPRDATGHLNNNINVVACDFKKPAKNKVKSYECGTQTQATDINKSTPAQTTSLLQLNKPFMKDPRSTSYAETSHHCQKYLSDCETCYSPTSGVQREDSQTQVSSHDIKSTVKTQTGESMMLTEKFPPPQLKTAADPDPEWGHLSVMDLPPEYQSVYAQTTRHVETLPAELSEILATVAASPGTRHHQGTSTN